MKAYKFLKDDKCSGKGSEPPWSEGKKRVYKGKISICVSGYHSSPSWYDALQYAEGSMACIVEVSKPVERQEDKYVSRECTIIRMVDAEYVLRDWGIRCAERALRKAHVKDERSWNVITVAKMYNDGFADINDLEAARVAARVSARVAARVVARVAAWAAAWEAAWEAAWAAAREAARVAADDAREAAWAAADDARVAARVAADDAREAETKYQKRLLNKMMKELINT